MNFQYYQFFCRLPIYFVIFGLFFISCSQEKNTFVSKNFHNTTAHYNAYFLAREKMHEVEGQIWLNNADDYNKILNVYPEISEATKSAINPGLEEVIKKASLIPEKHKNSNWLDDAYTIIGKSYLYKKEYKTSLHFFKFVNSKSKDINARYTATILLGRTYIDSMDYLSAKTAIDYINKKISEETEPMTKENRKDFLLLQAWYNQKIEEYDKMLPLLEEAVDLIPKKDIRARTHFIIGQLYQRQLNDTAAFKHYKLATKRNPPYELLFHAKLYMAQVSGTQNYSEKKMDKYFHKLLTDKKNVEYRDKIYYEMGNYELKNNDVPEAIKDYQKSIAVNKQNMPLKGLTYLKMGDVYYDQGNFERSKLYYDSTVAVWDKNDKRFRAIANRQKILAEFAGYVTTVQREDSLQKLAKLPKEKLDKFVTEVIEQEKQRKIQEEEAKKKAELLAKENPSNPSGFMNNLDENTSTFALTNTVAVTSGIASFRKIWGNRPLEDDWRRSTKEKDIIDEGEIEEDTVQVPKEKEISPEDSIKMEQANRDAYYKDIPFTQAQLDSSNMRIERGLFKIAQIYDQKLLEPKRSIENYGKLNKRFPESEYTPESYYSQYLIFKKLKDEKSAEIYRNKLLNEYPNSLYAKLLINPNYLQDNQVANQKAHQQYKIAFELFKNGKYKMVDSLIKNIKTEFPENDIDDKLSLLSILNFGQTGSPLKYNEMLMAYIKDYAASPMAAKAKELLDASENYIKVKEEKGEAVSSTDVKFSTNLDKPHFMAAVFSNTISKNKVLQEFKSFTKANKEEQNLTVEIKVFSDSTYIVTVKGFSEKFPAQVFINKVKDEKSFYRKNGYNQQSVFIITANNYQLLMDSKNLPLYLKFYKDNY